MKLKVTVIHDVVFGGLKKGLYHHKKISHVSPAPGGVSDMGAHLRTCGSGGWVWEGDRWGRVWMGVDGTIYCTVGGGVLNPRLFSCNYVCNDHLGSETTGHLVTNA